MKTLGCLACGIQMTAYTGYSSCLLLFCSGASGMGPVPAHPAEICHHPGHKLRLPWACTGSAGEGGLMFKAAPPRGTHDFAASHSSACAPPLPILDKSSTDKPWMLERGALPWQISNH